jgi:hypothetical protein
MTKSSRVNEEKIMDELFVLMEYSNSIKEFVDGMNKEQYHLLLEAMQVRRQVMEKDDYIRSRL